MTLVGYGHVEPAETGRVGHKLPQAVHLRQLVVLINGINTFAREFPGEETG